MRMVDVLVTEEEIDEAERNDEARRAIPWSDTPLTDEEMDRVCRFVAQGLPVMPEDGLRLVQELRRLQADYLVQRYRVREEINSSAALRMALHKSGMDYDEIGRLQEEGDDLFAEALRWSKAKGSQT